MLPKRIERLKYGLYGDSKPLQKSELSELRPNFGAAYRIYYFDSDNTLILFVVGSDKKTQDKVIK